MNIRSYISELILGLRPANAVTEKAFGLLPDRALIWLDFPDFKHHYIKEVYRSNVCFAGRGL